MPARIHLGLAAALLIAVSGSASAASYQPSAGPIAPPVDSAGTQPSSAAAYNQAAVNDPYNQADFSAQQSFGLVASQMLGAAAACEQNHAARVSLSRERLAKSAKGASDRADLDAAQQFMLDPAVTGQDSLKNGETDCDRIGASYSRLQEIQIQNQYLQKQLDQADATAPRAKAKQPR